MSNAANAISIKVWRPGATNRAASMCNVQQGTGIAIDLQVVTPGVWTPDEFGVYAHVLYKPTSDFAQTRWWWDALEVKRAWASMTDDERWQYEHFQKCAPPADGVSSQGPDLQTSPGGPGRLTEPKCSIGLRRDGGQQNERMDAGLLAPVFRINPNNAFVAPWHGTISLIGGGPDSTIVLNVSITENYRQRPESYREQRVKATYNNVSNTMVVPFPYRALAVEVPSAPCALAVTGAIAQTVTLNSTRAADLGAITMAGGSFANAAVGVLPLVNIVSLLG